MKVQMAKETVAQRAHDKNKKKKKEDSHNTWNQV